MHKFLLLSCRDHWIKSFSFFGNKKREKNVPFHHHHLHRHNRCRNLFLECLSSLLASTTQFVVLVVIFVFSFLDATKQQCVWHSSTDILLVVIHDIRIRISRKFKFKITLYLRDIWICACWRTKRNRQEPF